MSVSIRIHYFYGYPIDFKKRYKEVRKFNQDTGEPYQSKKRDGFDIYIDGQLIAHTKQEFVDKIEGLEVFCCVQDSRFLGINIDNTEDIMYREHYLELSSELPEKIRDALNAFKEKHCLKTDPRFFILPSICY